MPKQASQRQQHIERVLREVFGPSELEVQDDSQRHRGHAGAASGGGHFNVRIVSTAFARKNRLARHRLVYDALRDELSGEIHALSVKALTPEEAAAES